MANYVVIISDTLANLSKDNLKRFCHWLLNRKGLPQVRLRQVENKDYLDITDLMVSTFTEAGALKVCVEILRGIGCNNEAESLAGSLEKKNSSQIKMLPSEACAAADRRHFVDKHQVSLIQRVTNIPPNLGHKFRHWFSKLKGPLQLRRFHQKRVLLQIDDTLGTNTRYLLIRSPSTEANTTVSTPNSVEDVLVFLAQQVDKKKEFQLCVHKDGLPDRGIILWQRNKTSPKSALKVKFFGGDDTSFSIEFLTGMISGIENMFFEGDGNQGKNPKYSLTDICNFRTIGEIMAVSLAQGGPPPAFMKEWCYNFLCTGAVDYHSLSEEDVADYESRLLIRKVRSSTDAQTLSGYADKFVICGYTSNINSESKENIIRAIVLHSTTRLFPILQQLRKGLELYGLVDQMFANPEACHSLFVPGKIIKLDAHFIMINCKPQFSEKGTNKEKSERMTIDFLQDFLHEIEEADEEPDHNAAEGQRLTIPRVLQWMSGQSHIPILPAERSLFKITYKFDHDCVEQLRDHLVCYPIVSACTKTITFPVRHLGTYKEFQNILRKAVVGFTEFNKCHTNCVV